MPPHTDDGQPRLAVDRVFTLQGIGTVVTGTLIDGRLEVGQEVELVPAGLTSRIRGLQSHKQKLERVAPGTRVAANLSGIAHESLDGGMAGQATGSGLGPCFDLDRSARSARAS